MARLTPAVTEVARAKIDKDTKNRKQKRKYTSIFEEVVQERKKLKTIISVDGVRPSGFVFVASGSPLVTEKCKEYSRLKGLDVYEVKFSSSKGYFFERTTVDKAMLQLDLQLTPDGHTTTRVKSSYQRRIRDVADSRNVYKQAQLDAQARQRIRELYPRIPEWDLEQIVSRGFDLGTDAVGTAIDIPLERRVHLAVVAHIRHSYTSYDQIRMIDGKTTQTSRFQAREDIEEIAMQYLETWRAENEQGDSEAILREYIVITDNEDDSTESEDGDETDEGDSALPQDNDRNLPGLVTSSTAKGANVENINSAGTRMSRLQLERRHNSSRKKSKKLKGKKIKALRYDNRSNDTHPPKRMLNEVQSVASNGPSAYSEQRTVQVSLPRKAKIQKHETRVRAIQPGRMQEISALDRPRSFHFRNGHSVGTLHELDSRSQTHLSRYGEPERDLARPSVEILHEGYDAALSAESRSHRRVPSNTVRYQDGFERLSHRNDAGNLQDSFAPASHVLVPERAGEHRRVQPMIFTERRTAHDPKKDLLPAHEPRSAFSVSNIHRFGEPSIPKPQGSFFHIQPQGSEFLLQENGSRKTEFYQEPSRNSTDTQRSHRPFELSSGGRAEPASIYPYPSISSGSQPQPGPSARPLSRHEISNDPFRFIHRAHTDSHLRNRGERLSHQPMQVEPSGSSDPLHQSLSSPTHVDRQQQFVRGPPAQAPLLPIITSPSERNYSQGGFRSPPNTRMPPFHLERRQSMPQPVQFDGTGPRETRGPYDGPYRSAPRLSGPSNNTSAWSNMHIPDPHPLSFQRL